MVEVCHVQPRNGLGILEEMKADWRWGMKLDVGYRCKAGIPTH
jgi:hypothetical protein